METITFKQRSQENHSLSAVRNMARQLSITELTARLLMNRGITGIDAAERFLYPKPSDLSSSRRFRDMEKVLERIRRAVAGKEKIVIVGDYDADGICAAAIMAKTMTAMEADCRVALPNRFSDGYGLSVPFFEKLHAMHLPSLIITVDNGISSYDAVERAKQEGVDIIITDHHKPPERVPEVTGILNPKVEGETYPFSELCGAGIALRLSQALLETAAAAGSGREKRFNALVDELFALAALATVADIVPLIEENRTITARGLETMNEDANIGIAALALQAAPRASGAKREAKKAITASTIAYQLAPRINAAGRMENPDIAFRLLMADSPAEAEACAAVLGELNENRQEIETNVSQTAYETAEMLMASGDEILFIRTPNGHEGVSGIVAGKVSQTLNRPVVVVTESDGVLKGSARSPHGFDIYEALSCASSFFLTFGGHERAAGLSLLPENLTAARETVNRLFAEKAKRLSFRTKSYDTVSQLGQITQKAVLELEKMAPFGEANPRPVLRFDDVRADSVSFMGTTGDHISCWVMNGAARIRGVGFFKSALSDVLKEGAVSLLASAAFNEYRGTKSIQLEIDECIPYLECPGAYYESLYAYFCAKRREDIQERGHFTPPPESLAPSSASEMDYFSRNNLLVVYGKDTYENLCRQALLNSIPVHFSYGKDLSLKDGNINVFVNPMGAYPAADMPLAVLDRPCFFGYDTHFFTDKPHAVFFLDRCYEPRADITRDSVAFIYKKLKMLFALNGDIEKFVAFLNSTGEAAINPFTLRVSLDILSELSLVTWSESNGRLAVRLADSPVKKNINDSPLMVELRQDESIPE